MTSPTACGTCGRPVDLVEARVDAQELALAFTAGCGHPVDRDTASDAWSRDGLRWALPVVDGAALITAERRRQVLEEGFDAHHDEQHDPDALAWAAWAYIDRALHPSTGDDTVPRMWPWGAEAWKADASPERRLTIAGALIAAELDRLLRARRSRTNPLPDPQETP